MSRTTCAEKESGTTANINLSPFALSQFLNFNRMLSENLNYILKTCGQLRDPLCLFIFLSEIRFSPLGVRES